MLLVSAVSVCFDLDMSAKGHERTKLARSENVGFGATTGHLPAQLIGSVYPRAVLVAPVLVPHQAINQSILVAQKGTLRIDNPKKETIFAFSE